MTRFPAATRRPSHTDPPPRARTVPWLLLLSGCAALLPCCGREDAAQRGLPAPGHMRVLSVTPLADAAPDSGNLLPGGTFGQWWAGSPAPEGFSPPDSGHSTLIREPGTEGGRYLVRQTWETADTLDAPTGLFRAEIRDASPGQRLELAVTAESVGGAAAHISLWHATPGEAARLLDPVFITTQPGDRLLKTYTRAFDAPGPGVLHLAAHSAPVPGKEASVVWYAWTLRPASGRAE